MNETAKSECPKCGSELIVEFIREDHKVHNGIGMQTVARDEWEEVVEMTCDHNPGNYTEDEWDEIINNVEVDPKYKDAKDEGYI